MRFNEGTSRLLQMFLPTRRQKNFVKMKSRCAYRTLATNITIQFMSCKDTEDKEYSTDNDNKINSTTAISKKCYCCIISVTRYASLLDIDFIILLKPIENGDYFACMASPGKHGHFQTIILSIVQLPLKINVMVKLKHQQLRDCNV